MEILLSPKATNAKTLSTETLIQCNNLFAKPCYRGRLTLFWSSPIANLHHRLVLSIFLSPHFYYAATNNQIIRSWARVGLLEKIKMIQKTKMSNWSKMWSKMIIHGRLTILGDQTRMFWNSKKNLVNPWRQCRG